MERRRSVGTSGSGANDAVSVEEKPAAAEVPAVELRKPRHGGWKGKEPGIEDQMLHGEPGYHLGLFRVVYGILLVQRTLMFMSSGAVDASFSQGNTGPLPTSGGGDAPSPPPPRSVFNFGHGFLLLGELGSPSADVVRSACWCLCAAGAVLSVGYRSNAVAFAASIMQFYLLVLEKSLYTDEAYLFACLGLLLSFTDCGKALAVEAASTPTLEKGGGGQRDGRSAALRNQPPDTVPHWHVLILRFQVCIVHIHRGLAKTTTADWLLGGQPLLHTLEAMPPTRFVRRAAEWAASSGVPGIGGGGLKALAVRANRTMAFLDLFQGVCLLAAPRYRPIALALHTATELALAALGPRHARPWHLLLAVAGVLFLEPFGVQAFSERLRAWLQPAVSYDDGRRAGSRRSAAELGADARRRRRRSSGGGDSGNTGGDIVRVSPGGDAGAVGGVRDEAAAQGQGQAKKLPLQPRPSPATLALASLCVLVQVLLPLRHVLGVFPIEWSREGQEFSWRMGGGVGTGGELVREEALVRVTHRPRGGAKGGAGGEVQLVHLYGAPLTAQQVLRMVVDPDMLLQLAKKSAESSPAAGGAGGHGRGGRPKRDTGEKRPRTPPISSVDAWKSINGRPFSRWIDPSVDLWDDEFGEEGPSNAEWLEMPPSDDELDKASAVMEAVTTKWAMRDQKVTFFAARSGQTGLSNVFFGRYDPSNFNTTELCAVPPLPAAAADATRESGKTPEEEAGGILLGVALGEVQLLTDPEGRVSEPETRLLKVSTGVVLAPIGGAHSVRPSRSSSMGGRGALAVWYYVHSCPDGLFHLCAGFLSAAGWQQLYPPYLGARKGWTMEHGVPRG